MSQENIFEKSIQFDHSVPNTVAHEYSKSQLSSDDIDLSTFMVMPQIGEYIASKCKKFAYRVIRHQSASGCGQKLTVIFVADPTPISAVNNFDKKGIPVRVHNRKCTSHCLDVYYLTQPFRYAINAILN